MATTKKKPLASKKPAKKIRDILVNFKASSREYDLIAQNAKRFTKGNISKWLRVVGAKQYAKKQ